MFCFRHDFAKELKMRFFGQLKAIDRSKSDLSHVSVNIRNTGISDNRQIVCWILDKYKNHPSVLAIIQSPEQVLATFTFEEIGSHEVAQPLKSLDVKKSTGEDQIPPKLVSLAANELTNTLTTGNKL